jgi:hypothetical protein
MVLTVFCHRRQKKIGVAEHPLVFNHAGLLANEPPGKAELPFIKSSDDTRSCFGGIDPLADAGYPYRSSLSTSDA